VNHEAFSASHVADALTSTENNTKPKQTFKKILAYAETKANETKVRFKGFLRHPDMKWI